MSNNYSPRWLNLPPSLSYKFLDPSLQYGADYVASKYCRLLHIPKTIHGRWSHGWTAPYQLVQPCMATTTSASQAKETFFFVATKLIEDSLIKHGYKAKAIGLPIAYTEKKSLLRKPGSLLVMPQHSGLDTPLSHPFRCSVEEIDKIKHNFSSVVVCLHSACIENGYWVQEFRSAGYHVIEGANPYNRHSLQRMRDLFSQFEYVTTNGYSSLIPYACAFGAKVFLYGTYCELNPNDLLSNPYYRNNPDHASAAAWLTSYQIFKANYPHFFCSPCQAKQLIEWGLSQIGADCIPTPSEMRRLFGPAWSLKFSLKTSIYAYLRGSFGRIKYF